MTKEQDKALTRLTVRLRASNGGHHIGTGVVYAADTLLDKIYILTVAHCLYEDKDRFEHPRNNISIDFYSPTKNEYFTLVHLINYDLVSAKEDLDLAVLVLNKPQVVELTGELPRIKAIYEHHSAKDFLIKGFPSATQGQELAAIEPTWNQEMPLVSKFQLTLNQDYSTPESARSRVDGFSGGGVFLINNKSLYILGLFSRFREAGKVIYCQYLKDINQLLENAFLPLIQFTFLGEHGLNSEYFSDHIEKAIKNLGPRFNEELNFQLPIAMRFNDLARDNNFRHRLSDLLDRYLTASHYRSGTHELFKKIEEEYQNMEENIRLWFSLINWSPTANIETAEIIKAIEAFDKDAQDLIYTFYRLRSELRPKEGQKKEKVNHDEPFQAEISGLREMQKHNRELLNDLFEIDIKLTNKAVLLIKGEAGTGKSHLMGDVAKNRNNQGQPTILLLGQLFKENQSVWHNIKGQLELSCGKTDFLESLNHIGQQLGSRVLLMVDALNEGAGKNLWFNELEGFIYEIKQYAFIGLVLSIRSTYWNVVIPEGIKDSEEIRIVEHEGFRGNEYAALRLFCQHYGIVQPNFPILTPEYSRPLFLQLICRGIQATEQKAFPQGFQGITKIFQFYHQSLNRTFALKRSKYAMRPSLIKEALEFFALKSHQKEESAYLTLEEAHELMLENFPLFPNLFEDLIEESVLFRSMSRNYNTDDDQEIVYFAFERLGDYHTAKQLFAGYKTAQEVLSHGAKENVLGKLAAEGIWRNRGLMEAMAVLLPEKFELEIVELYHWVFDEKNERLDNFHDWLNQWMVDSMKWRDIASIDADKIRRWILDSGHFDMDMGNWFYFLMEVTSVKGHPFNSDRFHHIMKRESMALRDSFWQNHMQGYHGTDDQGHAFPLTRLIEWAWQEGISSETDEETARLVGQTLCWVLSSTNTGLRDQTTKALVNLLQDQPTALMKLMKTFEDIDDMYILERIYAVAYGCALRSVDSVSLEKIAMYTYDNIFAAGSPPEHILLRDYARNIIEYCYHHNLTLKVDMKLVRPPYRSMYPPVFPSEEDIKQYDLAPDEKGLRKTHTRSISKIHFSVMSWDFSRYVIDNALDHLVPVRFTLKTEIDIFKTGLKRGGKSYINNLQRFHDIINSSEEHKRRFFSYVGEAEAQELWNSYENWHGQFRDKLYAIMDDEQKYYFENTVLPYWTIQLKAKNKDFVKLEKEPYKRWIVQRVFDLGFDADLHGDFDSIHDDYTDHRSDNRVERIGKKYQWIAFYQLLSILTDHYKFRESWAYDNNGSYYQGPWEFMLRNIDPSFTLRQVRDKYTKEDFDLKGPEEPWWAMEKYSYWNRIPSDWANSIIDMPDAGRSVQKKDPNDTQWLHLNMSYTWKQPKQVGEDSYAVERREIWYMFQAYLIKKKDKEKVVNLLKDNNFHGRKFPEDHATSDLLAREHYWSPISKQELKERKEWVNFGESKFKVVLANRYAVGELSEDKSGAHFYYQMPCRTIFEGMDLKYARKDGDFLNQNGELVVSNESLNGAMIRKEDFLDFLDQSDLEVIWVFLGEKNSFSKNDHARDFRKSLSGVYYLENGELVGNTQISDW